MGQDLLIFHFAQFPLFFLGEKMNITPHCYSLSEKVVAALIVTGECGAETANSSNNNKDAIYIPPAHFRLVIFSC